jgi:hypothetical protein
MRAGAAQQPAAPRRCTCTALRAARRPAGERVAVGPAGVMPVGSDRTGPTTLR